MNILLRPLSGLLLCTTALMAPAVVFAQAADGPEVQELVVRGRYIPEVMRETAEVASIVTAEDLVRQGDGTAAEALTRLTGLSVVSGRFVYVRGLGERYSSALLNGSPLSPCSGSCRWTCSPAESWPASMCRSPTRSTIPASSAAA